MVVGVRCDFFRYLPCCLSYANGSCLSVEKTAPSSRSSLRSTSLMISRARGSTVLTFFMSSQSRLAEGWVPFSFSKAAALSQLDRSRLLAVQAGATSSALAKKTASKAGRVMGKLNIPLISARCRDPVTVATKDIQLHGSLK